MNRRVYLEKHRINRCIEKEGADEKYTGGFIRKGTGSTGVQYMIWEETGSGSTGDW